MTRLILSAALWLGLTSWMAAQSPRRSLPPPLRVYVSFELAWSAAIDTLKEIEQQKGVNLELLQQDRGRGYLLTRFCEYGSGTLTDSHISKIGERPKLTDGEWVRVEYQYEIEVEVIQARETLVTVSANVRTLKRGFLGTESWVNILSNGQLEENYLESFGKLLFGESFRLAAPKKGFWERDPSYVPDPAERIPKMVGPERPRPD